MVDIRELPHRLRVAPRTGGQRVARRRRRAVIVARGLTGIVVTLIIWEIVAKAYDLEVILPPPNEVVKNTWNVLTLQGPWRYGSNIYRQTLTSLYQAAVGFGFGVLAAVPLGMLIGRSRAANEFISPVIKGLYPIPAIAWIPLTILWFGLTPRAIIVTVALDVFFPVLFNVQEGAREIPPILIDAGRCFGAARIRLLTRVVLPGVVPFLISGLRIGVGSAWRMAIAGEILISQSGVGYVLNQSRFYFKTADLLTSMIIVAFVGYASERLIVGTLERRTIEMWRGAP